MSHDFVFTGVGGQGVLVAANAVGEAATAAGLETRVGEIHGMSQRGGSVVAHVRIGEDVRGATVPEGLGDAMFALEPMEALRYADYLASDADLLVNDVPVIPLPVQQGEVEYPDVDAVLEALAARGELVAVDAAAVARDVGDAIVANTVLLGAFSVRVDLPLSADELLEGVETMVPDDAVDLNRTAFEAGRDAVGQDRVEPAP